MWSFKKKINLTTKSGAWIRAFPHSFSQSTGFHRVEQHWQPQGHTSIRDFGEFKHCRSTPTQRHLSPSPSLFLSLPRFLLLSSYLRWAPTLRLLQVLLSVINSVLMAYSFCSSTHISLVYFPTLVNLGTCHKRSDIRAIISGNYQMPSHFFSLSLSPFNTLSTALKRDSFRSLFDCSCEMWKRGLKL